MNEKIEKLMTVKKIEQEIYRAINKCDLGFYERLELEDLTADYQKIENVSVCYKNFSYYYYNGEIVFVRVLNTENGYGREIYIPEKMSEKEYEFIITEKKEINYPFIFALTAVISFIIIFVAMVFFIIESLRDPNNGAIEVIIAAISGFFPVIILDFILFAISRLLKKK